MICTVRVWEQSELWRSQTFSWFFPILCCICYKNIELTNFGWMDAENLHICRISVCHNVLKISTFAFQKRFLFNLPWNKYQRLFRNLSQTLRSHCAHITLFLMCAAVSKRLWKFFLTFNWHFTSNLSCCCKVCAFQSSSGFLQFCYKSPVKKEW